MKRTAIVFLILAAWCIPALALNDDFDITIGLWDDVYLKTSTGTATAMVPKTLWLGVKSPRGLQTFTGLEFSISGVREAEDGVMFLCLAPLDEDGLLIGTPVAPADTTDTSTGTGGMNLAWASCKVGNRAVLKIIILTTGEVSNKVFQVKRRYPTSNPSWKTPVLVQCDSPAYSITRVTGGCYVLNWNGDLRVPCTGVPVTAIESATWAGVKELFRDAPR
jgi:hypothetical protein